MPFTFAHPAAAVPLRGPLGRFGVLSALCTGSIAPDLVYFVPLGVTRQQSHGLAGLLWFCLPAGLVCYSLYHAVLRRPLVALLPVALQRRLPPAARSSRRMPDVSWVSVSVSVLVGAITHLVWDSFTHAHAFGVAAFPVLYRTVGEFGGRTLAAYELLQHLSGVFGLALLAAWTLRFLRRQEPSNVPPPLPMASVARSVTTAVVLLVPLLLGSFRALQELDGVSGFSALEVVVGQALFTTIPAFVVLVSFHAVLWNLRERSRRTTA